MDCRVSGVRCGEGNLVEAGLAELFEGSSEARGDRVNGAGFDRIQVAVTARGIHWLY